MKRLFFPLCCLVTLGVTSAIAQAPSAGGGQNPLSASLKRQYDAIKRNLSESAQKMSEADYSFRATPEVRTFGGFIGHVANAQFLICARAKGEKNPQEGVDFEKKTTKADLVKAINDSIAYCDGVYDSLTDTSALELIKVPGPNNTQMEVPRAAPLIGNIAHDNEHYGNLVTYMRLKGLVPPSTERAQQQRRPSNP